MGAVSKDTGQDFQMQNGHLKKHKGRPDASGFQKPGSSVHGISQATILEWVAISFSKGYSQPIDLTQVSCIAGVFFITEAPGKLSSRVSY